MLLVIQQTIISEMIFCFPSVPIVVEIIGLMPHIASMCRVVISSHLPLRETNILPPPSPRDTCDQFCTNHSLTHPLCQHQHTKHTKPVEKVGTLTNSQMATVT